MEPNEDRLNSFFKGMQYYLDVSREARQGLASAVANSFSIFDYLQPSENLLSRIISDLLDPRGNHGQGSTFLKSFLEQLVERKCKLPSGWETRADHAIVATETSTSINQRQKNRYSYRTTSGFRNRIENKPWANEQISQLADYRDELYRRYGGQFVLIFLCQRGRTLTSIPAVDWKKLEDHNQGAILHYSDHFLTWLVNCQEKSQADKIRHFLKDFEKFVRSTLGGESLMDDLNHVQ